MSLIADSVKSGFVESAALLIRTPSHQTLQGFGKATATTPFLIASITKPMTASAVMIVRDQGKLSLDDPVRKHLPAFAGDGREKVTIRHLLTHTSGLPDMLPENEELRKKHAPLSAFVSQACRTPLLFEPGTKVSYQSMGILLAAEIVQQITGTALPSFLREHVYRPLSMDATSLGLGGRPLTAMARLQVDAPSDWDWNSEYWRNLAAPWGGAHATVGDIATFLEAFAGKSAAHWKPETAREMVTLQTRGLAQRWGLGWRLGAGGAASSPETWGHSGSTGTLSWHDPARRLTFVLLTSKPAEHSNKPLLTPVSNTVAKAFA